MNSPYRERLTAIVLLLGLLLPIWLGPHAPQFDYANHLLEAQVVVHYADAQLDYAASYALRPTWPLETNALSNLILIGLGQFLPIPVAGQVMLSLYVVVFFTGLWRLLRGRGLLWPLISLAPILIYNRAYTAGWINFYYGAALGLHALATYWHWRAHRRWLDVLGLATLTLLMFMAHLMAWLLGVVSLALMVAVDEPHWRSRWPLVLALNSAVPLMAYTWPALALAAFCVTCGIWLGMAVIRQLKLNPPTITALTLGLIGAGAAALKFGQDWLQPRLPDFGLNAFNKVAALFRVFTWPHQFDPPLGWLEGFNVVLWAGGTLIAGMLLWATYSEAELPYPAGWAALAGLGLLYIFLPSDTPYLRDTEPRTLLFAALVALTIVRLPSPVSQLYRSLTYGTMALGGLSLLGFMAYTLAFQQRATAWEAQLATLAPAQRVLVFTPQRQEDTAPALTRWFDSFYRGVNFSTVYALEQGGYVSQTFNNGPVRPQPGLPTPIYYWDDAENVQFITEQCAELKAIYDVVLVWGQPSPALRAALDQCFTPLPPLPDLTTWVTHP